MDNMNKISNSIHLLFVDGKLYQGTKNVDSLKNHKLDIVEYIPVIKCEKCKWLANKNYLSRSGHCICPNRDCIRDDDKAFEAVYFNDYCSYGEEE